MQLGAVALNRFGLGGKGGQDAPADPHAWLLAQFDRFDPHPSAISALPASDRLIVMLREARDDQKERKADARTQGGDLKAKAAGMGGPYRELRDAYVAAVGARTAIALGSDTPFIERLVHFWANHFAVSVDKVATVGLAGAFEFEAIRPHVLGHFRDMLSAVERHPAMLLYLDQAESVGPDSPLGTRAARRGRQRGLNENLAREIMELHTLGVRSGYSQADVTEFARALTGWTVGGLAKQPLLQGPGPRFWFAAPIHEPGSRTIIGMRYGQSGEGQAQAVLDDLAVHPATARHVATKLARHFAADDPPPALIAKLEHEFLRTGGDLPALYRVLIEAPETWHGAPKFRTPWEWSLAALRATGVAVLPGATAAGAFTQLGQAVWKPGSPAGYDDIAASWAGPDALYRRVEVAQRIAQRAGPAIDARHLAGELFPGSLSETTTSAIARAESGTQALALLLASPEMMRR
ncbi:MAG: DUF1800 domain-containing protein [Proteobacteria bacterium]|nr:DUF1800 domain-containing protein [Pseudomonadota bacterium]